MSVEECYEYGYRITSGVGNGSEIPARIREELAKANTTGIILRRKVTVKTGPTEEIGHAPESE